MNQDHLIMQSQRKAKLLLTLQIFSYYLLVYLIGIITFLKLRSFNIIIETIAPAESVWNSFYIIGSIIIATIVLLLIIKYIRKLPILKILEHIVVFLTLSLFISLFIQDIFAILIAVFLIIIKELWKNFLLRNLIVSIMVGFIGGYIAYALGILPIVVLLLLVAIYDYIAVFKTKHMVYLAQNIVDKNTVFTYELRTSDKPLQKTVENVNSISSNKKIKSKFDLGTGDFALPLIAIVKFTFINIYLGLFCFLFVIIALLLTIFYLINNENAKALPAIPLQAIIILIFYVIYLII